MNAASRILAALVLASALAACSGDNKQENGVQAAGGEVLKGSISDDMLPYDTLRSQPPLASAEPSEGAQSSGSESPALEDQADAGPGEGQVAADTAPDQPPAAE